MLRSDIRLPLSPPTFSAVEYYQWSMGCVGPALQATTVVLTFSISQRPSAAFPHLGPEHRRHLLHCGLGLLLRMLQDWTCLRRFALDIRW